MYINYHDTEWGVPVKNDQKQFEFLILETFQAGLSWYIVLKKRENFRIAFDQFDYNKVARFNQSKLEKLYEDAGIIRNKLKINAAVNNAQQFIKIREEFGTFTDYIWSFTGGETVHNTYKELSEIPASTDLSDQISKDLKKRGFKFVGTTVIYAHLQASGIVNDHLTSCFRWKELQ